MHEADPSATRAWTWRMAMVREEVLGHMLLAERQRVERKMKELRDYHAEKQRSMPHTTLGLQPFDSQISVGLLCSALPLQPCLPNQQISPTLLSLCRI